MKPTLTYVSISRISWVINCIYTRHRDFLLSASLTQIWQKTLMIREPFSGSPKNCASFSYQRSLMVFHWNPIDSESPQVSRILVGNLSDISNAEVRTSYNAVYRLKEETTILGYKNIALFINLGVYASVECERRTMGDTEKLLYWPIIYSTLDHSTLYYLQDCTNHFFCFLAEVLNLRPLWAAKSHSLQWIALNDSNLAPTHALTGSISIHFPSRHLHISFLNATTSHRSHDCFRFLTARSRVNMQHVLVST